jgi:DNA-binding transcriptional ArsR family regulator
MKTTYCPNLKKMPLSTIFNALSDPVRMQIIISLLEEEEISCGQCKDHLLSKSTMSHHFKVLREAGLIQRREEGKTHFISLRLEELESRLPGFLDILKQVRKPF